MHHEDTSSVGDYENEHMLFDAEGAWVKEAMRQHPSQKQAHWVRE
jgi:hypothetical protein